MDAVFQDGLFDNEVVLVTGGGTGLGLCAATEIGRLGGRIAICGRREEPLVQAASALSAQGIQVYHATCDIRDAESVGAFVEAVRDHFGKVDVLVNNAGGQYPTPAAALVPKGFEAVVRNNLIGTWVMTHTVATKCFIPQKRGRIINIIADVERGFPGMAHTGAARAGVDNLTKTLAIEWSVHGIRVNAIAPGVIVTSGTGQYPTELLDSAKERNPMRRLGAPEEVSHLITYLASRYADYINGQTIYIDGGANLWGESWYIPDDVPQSPPYPVPDYKK